jgi:hypothetical protein
MTPNPGGREERAGSGVKLAVHKTVSPPAAAISISTLAASAAPAKALLSA